MNYDSIEAQVSFYFEGMKTRKKKKDTRNPHYPFGMHRRSELLTEFPSLTSEELVQVHEVGDAYWGVQDPSEWQVDPLESDVDRDARSECVHRLLPIPLAFQYVAHRTFTRQLCLSPSRLPRDYALANNAASNAIDELQRTIRAAPVNINWL